MIQFFVAVMALTAIGVVAWPLVRKTGDRKDPGLVEDSELGEILAQKDAALLAISELEADYEMRNLSQDDYLELRNKYAEYAMALLKSVDELRSERVVDTATRIDEEIEARVARMRRAREGQKIAGGNACPTCQATVLSDAAFCSRCGTALKTHCYVCSAAVSADDRFCLQCGAALNTTTPE